MLWTKKRRFDHLPLNLGNTQAKTHTSIGHFYYRTHVNSKHVLEDFRYTDMQLDMQLDMPMATRTVHSVSEITDLLKSLIEQQPHLQNLWVQGQVSNYSRSGAGHIYFTLSLIHI